MEQHDLIIRYVSALGFPIVMALAMGWALLKLGSLVISSYATTLAENTAEMKKQTGAIQEMKLALPTICQARRNDSDECENYRPKARP